MAGWVKLPRKLLESKIFASEKGLKIWIWLILKANHKERYIPITIAKGQSIVHIKRGQMIFGRISAEEELRISRSVIYKWIKKMERDKMITIESNNHYSIITICKYDEYNDSTSAKVASKEQPNSNQEIANEQPQDILKNEEKHKNEETSSINLSQNDLDEISKNNLSIPFKSPMLSKVWNELCAMPKWRKKPAASIKMNLEKLSEYDEDYALELIKRAIAGNYQGLFFKNTDREYYEWLNRKAKPQQILIPSSEKKSKLLKKFNNE